MHIVTQHNKRLTWLNNHNHQNQFYFKRLLVNCRRPSGGQRRCLHVGAEFYDRRRGDADHRHHFLCRYGTFVR